MDRWSWPATLTHRFLLYFIFSVSSTQYRVTCVNLNCGTDWAMTHLLSQYNTRWGIASFVIAISDRSANRIGSRIRLNLKPVTHASDWTEPFSNSISNHILTSKNFSTVDVETHKHPSGVLFFMIPPIGEIRSISSSNCKTPFLKRF